MKKSILSLLLVLSAFIASAAPLTIGGTQTSPSCPGNCDGSISLSVTGGTAPYSYLWSNGATSASITGLCADTFTVVVTDAAGATKSQTRIIRNPYAVKSNFNIVNASCNGACDGSLTSLPYGGTGPYTYQWNNGATSAQITGLCAGTYSVTVTDSKGCTFYCHENVTQPAALLGGIQKADATCAGNCNGSATASASGGKAPYSYLWSNGATSAQITGLCAGNYTVTITDAGNCNIVRNVTINENAALNASCSVVANESYAGAADGSLLAAANGGNSPYSYVWSNGATTAQINGLVAGTYTVTISDAAGCSAQTSCSIITLQQNCGGFRTQTQGGWGQCQQNGNNPGTYLANNFAGAFPNGLTVGCTNTLKLTSAAAVCAFLPSGSTPRKLNLNFVDPTNYNNVLAGQVVALTLSVGFDNYDANFGASGTSLGGQIIVNGTFAGWTVKQLLDTANKVLGGCASNYTPAAINGAVSSINENYVDGKEDHGFLRCPGTSRISNMNTKSAEIYPNPSNTSFNVRTSENRSANIRVMDLSGKMMEMHSTIGGEISIGEQLRPGAYILNIEYIDGQKESQKILKTN